VDRSRHRSWTFGKRLVGRVGLEPTTGGYEKYGPYAPSVLAAQITRIIALAALTALGLSSALVHEPVHARGPSAPSSCYCA
jgi:hypothetical protein